MSLSFLTFHPNLSFQFPNIPTTIIFIYAIGVFIMALFGHFGWKQRKMDEGLSKGAPIVGVLLWLFLAMLFYGHWTMLVLLPGLLIFGWWQGRDLARRPIQWRNPSNAEKGGEAD